MFESIDGSCSLLLLNAEGVYAARDRWGIRASRSGGAAGIGP